MSSSQQIAEVEILGNDVLIIFEPEQAALLSAMDLYELAKNKNAFIKVQDDDILNS